MMKQKTQICSTICMLFIKVTYAAKLYSKHKPKKLNTSVINAALL